METEKLFGLIMTVILFSSEDERNRFRAIILSTEMCQRLYALSRRDVEDFSVTFRPFILTEDEWEIVQMDAASGMEKEEYENKKNLSLLRKKRSWFNHIEMGKAKPQ